MARLFDDGASEYLSIGSAVLTGVPISMACWYNSDDLTIMQWLMGISDTAGANDYFGLALGGQAAGDYIYAYTKRSTTDKAITTAGYSANTWEHACAVFAAANSRAVYINGGNKGTDVTSRTPISLDTTTIGALKINVVSTYTSGLIAEAAMWNIALSDDEVAILAAGYSPLFVRPQNIVAYWPLVRGLNDRVGGYNMAATGTLVADHPRIIYPKNPQLPFIASAEENGIVIQSPKILAPGYIPNWSW